MRWHQIRGLSGVSYYSGRIGDPDCKYIHEHDGLWHVAKGVYFDELSDAKSWFALDHPHESCDT